RHKGASRSAGVRRGAAPAEQCHRWTTRRFIERHTMTTKTDWPGRAARALLGCAFVGALTMAVQIARTDAQQLPEVMIRNGLIVNADNRMEADVRIRGEQIVEIGQKLAASAGAREIDASGMFLLPGIIDTHTHLPLDVSIAPPPKG